MSALRSGAPVKSRADVYALLDAIDFDVVLKGNKVISSGVFDAWHEAAVGEIRRRKPRLCAGWAAKIVNVYLKTAVYLAGMGRPGLAACIHPPLDAGLWAGLQRRFANQPDILARTHKVSRIKDLCEYEDYAEAIAGCRMGAAALDCSLIEIEQLWEGSRTPSPLRSAAATGRP